VLKYVQIQFAITVAMTIIHHYIRSRQVTLWIHPVHYVPAKNSKNNKSYDDLLDALRLSLKGYNIE
jgi:hypothetical protein